MKLKIKSNFLVTMTMVSGFLGWQLTF